MKKIRWPIALIAIAVIALSLPLVASADHTWGRYAWATPGGPALSLGDNLDLGWDAFLETANDDWNDSPWITNSVDPGRTASPDCIPATGLVEICNSEYGENGWLGVAGIWIAKGKQITKGYVKVNDTYFNKASYNTLAWRQMVMCQEVGHIFGLAHQDEDFYNPNLDTCMDYTSNPGTNQHPNDHDYDQLAAMYGSGGGGDSGPGPGNGNGKGNNGKNGQSSGMDHSQWGRAISTDGKGRPDLFELDLGNGNKLITHVLWAD